MSLPYGIFLLAMTLFVLWATYYFLSALWKTGKSIAKTLKQPIAENDLSPEQPISKERVPTAEELRVLQSASEGCLAIRHVFPPRHPRRSLSFLGGQPVAPSDFEWQMAHNSEGLLEWLTFIGQINCADIPKGEHTSIFPYEGVLYFFLPTGSNVTQETEKLAVKYISTRPSSSWEEHRGMILPPVNGLENAGHDFAWMNWMPNAHKSYPTAYPRIEIELGWLDYGGEVLPGDADDGDSLPHEVKNQRYHKNLVAFHGEPIEHDPLLYPYGKPNDIVWRVHEGFPLSWLAIEVICGHLRVLLQEQKALLQEAQEAGAESKMTLPESPEKLLQLYEHLEARATKIMVHVPRGLQEPAPAEKAEFWALLDSLMIPEKLPLISKRSRNLYISFLINKWLSEAAILSAEACLNDPTAAQRVPIEVINGLRERHSVLKSHMFKDRGWHMQHQMLGKGDVVQEAADRMGETHLLLLQLSSDDALGIQMGDNGVYQFWITPADLTDLRFDKTIVTFECH